MFGLDEIGGVWQEVGEWSIILIGTVGIYMFWRIITSIAIGAIRGPDDKGT